jgi:alkylation response protein AidB-like acyl-CoA dehydrogenase
MDFTLTDEQIMFREQVLKFARREIVPRVQEHDLRSEFDRQSWKKMGEFGILGLQQTWSRRSWPRKPLAKPGLMAGSP